MSLGLYWPQEKLNPQIFCFILFFLLPPASEYISTFELCIVMSVFVGFPDAKFTTLNTLRFTVERPFSLSWNLAVWSPTELNYCGFICLSVTAVCFLHSCSFSNLKIWSLIWNFLLMLTPATSTSSSLVWVLIFLLSPGFHLRKMETVKHACRITRSILQILGFKITNNCSSLPITLCLC